MLIRLLLGLFLDFILVYFGFLSYVELYFIDFHLLVFLWLPCYLCLRHLWHYLLLLSTLTLCFFVLAQVHRKLLSSLRSHHLHLGHDFFLDHQKSNIFLLLLFLLLSLKVTTGETILEGVVALSQTSHRDQLLDPAHFLLQGADTLGALLSDIAYVCLNVLIRATLELQELFERGVNAGETSFEGQILGCLSCGELVFYSLVDGGEVWLLTRLISEGGELGGEV